MTEEEHRKLKLLLNSDSGVNSGRYQNGKIPIERDYEIIEIVIRNKINEAQQRLLKKLDVKALVDSCQNEDNMIDQLRDDLESELKYRLQPLLERYQQFCMDLEKYHKRTERMIAMKKDYEMIESEIRNKIEKAQQRLLEKLDVKVLLTGCQHEDDIIDRLQDDFEAELDYELQPLLEEYLQLQAAEAEDLQDTVRQAWREAHGM